MDPLKIHNHWLDTCRFVCSLLVVMAHLRNDLFTQYDHLLEDSKNIFSFLFFCVTRLGGESVIIFFALSGYLVGGRLIEKVSTPDWNIGDWAIDRVSRVYLPLIPAVILSVLLAESSTAPTLLTVMGNIFGLQGVVVEPLTDNAPLWSLSYEIWFYLIAYALARISLRQELDVTGMFILVAATMIFTKLHVEYFTCWAIGALLYVKQLRTSNFWRLLLGGIGSLVAICIMQVTRAETPSTTALQHALHVIGEIGLAASFGIFAQGLRQLPTIQLSRTIAPKAAFSYTLYLTHYPLLKAYERLGFERSAKLDAMSLSHFFLVLVALVAVAWLIYLPFERNTTVVRRWLRAKLLPDTTAQTISS